jgi:hypothetical protein
VLGIVAPIVLGDVAGKLVEKGTAVNIDESVDQLAPFAVICPAHKTGRDPADPAINQAICSVIGDTEPTGDCGEQGFEKTESDVDRIHVQRERGGAHGDANPPAGYLRDGRLDGCRNARPPWHVELSG